MPSFTTMFRATVMVAAGAGAFKGWQAYGPPTEKVKSVAMRAVDMAQAAWKNYQNPAHENQPSADPPSVAPLAQAAGDMTITAPPLAAQTLTPSTPIDSPAIGSTSTMTPIASQPPAAPSTTIPSSDDERVRTLLARLEQLGGSSSTVAAWGSSGHLFRCCCQAPVTESAAVKQHFEAVAAEPALAVEQVVAKIEASRLAQRTPAGLRY